MKVSEILEALDKAAKKGETVQLITIHPEDFVDLIKENDSFLLSFREKRYLELHGIRIEVNPRVTKGRILINAKFPDFEWNPSSRW